MSIPDERYKKIFYDLLIKAIGEGDQVIWNYLYPYLGELEYLIDPEMIRYFAVKIGEINDPRG